MDSKNYSGSWGLLIKHIKITGDLFKQAENGEIEITQRIGSLCSREELTTEKHKKLLYRMFRTNGDALIIKKDGRVIGGIETDLSGVFWYPLMLVPLPFGEMKITSHSEEGNEILGKYM